MPSFSHILSRRLPALWLSVSLVMPCHEHEVVGHCNLMQPQQSGCGTRELYTHLLAASVPGAGRFSTGRLEAGSIRAYLSAQQVCQRHHLTVYTGCMPNSKEPESLLGICFLIVVRSHPPLQFTLRHVGGVRRPFSTPVPDTEDCTHLQHNGGTVSNCYSIPFHRSQSVSPSMHHQPVKMYT